MNIQSNHHRLTVTSDRFKMIVAACGTSVILLITNFIVSNNEKPTTMDCTNMNHFQEEIVSIDKEIKDLTWPAGLFKYPFFKEVFSHPRRYLSYVTFLLASEEITEQQKIIMALSMQQLSLKDFLLFGDAVLRILEKNRISNDVFKWAVFPTYDWNVTLIKNYRSKGVKMFFEKISNSQYVSSDIKMFVQNEIQTGKAHSQIKHLKEIGSIK